MNWVAVDIGASTVKASVLDKNNKPVRLLYSMGSYETTSLSSIVAVANDQDVIIGDFALHLGVNNPNLMVYDWAHSQHKKIIAKSILKTVKDSAIKHYSSSEIAVVILYTNIMDEELYNIAGELFCDVKAMRVGDVVKRILSPHSNLMLVADFGDSAFRVMIQDNCRSLILNSNPVLGFSSIDMLSFIECENTSSCSTVEIALLGQLMKYVKILVNNGEKVVIPNSLPFIANCSIGGFEHKMTTFLYQCFEECTNALKEVSKSWNDLSDVVFIGGGAHSSIITSVFNKYMQSYHQIQTYNSRTVGFDAQFSASHCAIQMPLRVNTGVIIKY